MPLFHEKRRYFKRAFSNFVWNLKQPSPNLPPMPIWFRNPPSELADPTEQRVAEILDRLEGDWRIRWGYYYSDGNTSREGDFIIQGPKGQILVMEVKGGQNRQFLLTGRWEGCVNAIESILTAWIGGKLCKVHDIVIMGFNRSLADSKTLGTLTEIGRYPLADYTHNGQRDQLRYIGIHRAKGLDFLGVILIDMAAPDVLAKDEDWDRAETFFYGATRARQLLGVVAKESE